MIRGGVCYDRGASYSLAGRGWDNKDADRAECLRCLLLTQSEMGDGDTDQVVMDGRICGVGPEGRVLRPSDIVRAEVREAWVVEAAATEQAKADAAKQAAEQKAIEEADSSEGEPFQNSDERPKASVGRPQGDLLTLKGGEQ